MILSKSMTGAMWKSNTKYWRRQTFKNDSVEIVITNMWFDIGDFWLWGWEPHCSTGSWCFPSQKWTFWCRPPKCWLFQSYAQSSVNLSMLSHNSQKKIVRVPLSSSSSCRMMKILKDLDTDNWVHVKTSQLSSLYHSDAYLDQNYWNHDMTM